MKKLRSIYLLLCLTQLATGTQKSCCQKATSICSCPCAITSKTFFMSAPAFQGIRPERLMLFPNRLWAQEDGNHGMLRAVGFGGRSTEPGKLAVYFAPTCKAALRVKENPEEPADIRAQYFNIQTVDRNFESIICFSPSYATAGVGLNYKQSLACRDAEKGFWIEIASPITYVATSMGFTETIINDGGGAVNDLWVGSMAEAFVQPSWQYGRIWACPKKGNNCNTPCKNACDGVTYGPKMHKVGLADIDIRLGYEFIKEEITNLEGYIGVLIPTGNKAKSLAIFEPIVGNNHHVGLMAGGASDWCIWQSDCSQGKVFATAALHGMYLLSNTQRRLIDVKNKPWSHYMWTYKDQAQAEQAHNLPTGDFTGLAAELNTPGVNVFALPVCVNPGLQTSANISLMAQGCAWGIQLGYNYFSRAAECVKPARCYKEAAAFKSYVVGSDAKFGATDDVQTIDNYYRFRNQEDFSNYNLSIITRDDLDFASAAHPRMIEHRVYNELGYRADACRHPLFATVGGSYTFTPDNAGLPAWLLWANLGISF